MIAALGAASLDAAVPGGLNRYTAELSRSLSSASLEILVYTADRRSAATMPGRVRRIRPHAVARSGFAGLALRMLWHQLALPRLLRRDGASVYYSTVAEGMIAPPCPQVITIHDVVPLLYPECHPRMKHYYRHVLPRVVQVSDQIVVTSEATRRDVERHFPVGDKPIHVVYQGFRTGVFKPVSDSEVRRVKASHGLGSFLLTVGEMRPYKNFARLISAFATAGPDEVQLVHVGRALPREVGLLDLPRSLGIADRVRFLGTVDDRDLAALYTAAEAFVFPSLYEGFGIPPLEAMACGCPVVASRAASIPEVCGDAAIYVDPADEESIAGGIREIVARPELRVELGRKGLERAERFSYVSAASRVLEILGSYDGGSRAAGGAS